MTAKEYLNQAYWIDKRINSKIEQVAMLRDRSLKITSVLSNTPKARKAVHSGEHIIAKLIDMENEINTEIDKLVDMKRDAYLSARQKNGVPLGADTIYRETWRWLKERNCEKLVNKRLIEAYSQAFARYIQCEEATSNYDLLGKHPTTGGVIASPFVQMSQQYQKSANLIWYEIYDIVKQNCTVPFEDTPNDTMELLLRRKRGI